MEAMKHQKNITPQEFEQMKAKIKKKNRFNKYLNKSYLDKGVIRWRADGIVNQIQVKNVFEVSMEHGRYLHCNTGTHGKKDGSTAFTNPELMADEKYVNDMEQFWDEDMSLLAKKFDDYGVSAQQCNDWNWPVYTKRLDTIDNWSYSAKTHMYPPYLASKKAKTQVKLDQMTAYSAPKSKKTIKQFKRAKVIQLSFNDINPKSRKEKDSRSKEVEEEKYENPIQLVKKPQEQNNQETIQGQIRAKRQKNIPNYNVLANQDSFSWLYTEIMEKETLSKVNKPSNLIENQKGNTAQTQQQKEFNRLLKKKEPEQIYFKEETFEKQRRVGGGSFGEVFICQNIKGGETFAVKIMNICDEEPEDIKSFINEAKLLMGLDHPNILKVYDYTIQEYTNGEKFLYFLMPLCKKQNLEQKFTSLHQNYGNKHRYENKNIQDDPQFMDYTLDTIEQVLEGMKYLIQKEIVHRDLKPQNLLLKEDPSVKYERVLIGDFGTARKRGTQLANTGIIGSVYYMSPQVMNWYKNVEEKKSGEDEKDKNEIIQAYVGNDVWSIGCIIYRMITGNICFSDFNSFKWTNVTKIKYQKQHLTSKRIQNILDKIFIMEPTERIKIHELSKQVKQARQEISLYFKKKQTLKQLLQQELEGELKKFEQQEYYKNKNEEKKVEDKIEHKQEKDVNEEDKEEEITENVEEKQIEEKEAQKVHKTEENEEQKEHKTEAKEVIKAKSKRSNSFEIKEKRSQPFEDLSQPIKQTKVIKGSLRIDGFYNQEQAMDRYQRLSKRIHRSSVSEYEMEQLKDVLQDKNPQNTQKLIYRMGKGNVDTQTGSYTVTTSQHRNRIGIEKNNLVAQTNFQKVSQDLFKQMKLQIKKINRFNPFLDESYITPRGTIHWMSSHKVNKFFVKAIFDISLMCNRSLHINSGTHGFKSGETIFSHPSYKSSERYVNDIDIFIQQNSEQLIQKGKIFTCSFTEVNINVWPQYRPNLDTIDAWDYSARTKPLIDYHKELQDQIKHQMMQKLKTGQQQKKQMLQQQLGQVYIPSKK